MSILYFVLGVLAWMGCGVLTLAGVRAYAEGESGISLSRSNLKEWGIFLFLGPLLLIAAIWTVLAEEGEWMFKHGVSLKGGK